MSQLDGTVQFWRATGSYLCVAKLKNQWFYVGCSLGEYEHFLADCKRRGMLPTSVRKPCPVRALFKRYGSIASALKDHLPHYARGNGNTNGTASALQSDVEAVHQLTALIERTRDLQKYPNTSTN